MLEQSGSLCSALSHAFPEVEFENAKFDNKRGLYSLLLLSSSFGCYLLFSFKRGGIFQKIERCFSTTSQRNMSSIHSSIRTGMNSIQDNSSKKRYSLLLFLLLSFPTCFSSFFSFFLFIFLFEYY